MIFILTHHAKIRMREREVSEDEVADTLSNFHTSRPGSDGSTGLYAIARDESTLVVWIVGGIPLREPVVIKSVGKERKR